MRSFVYFLCCSIGFLVASCHEKIPASDASITIKGSDTEYPLVKHLAEEFSKDQSFAIMVSSGGTAEGFKALSMDECVIANASRSITEEEAAFNTKKGHLHSEIVIAIDAIAIITNPKLGIDSLSTLQLARILDGTFTNWKSLGGPDVPIVVFTRNEASGTNAFIRNQFCKQGFPKNSVTVKDNEEVIKKINKHLGGIGYVGSASIREKSGAPSADVWAMNLYIEGSNACSPFQELSVISGEYPLVRPLYQYINDRNNKWVQKFLHFELSAKGQQLVKRYGFYPLTSNYQEQNKRNGFE
jgi:phosphate transport system substrate-binding protein